MPPILFAVHLARLEARLIDRFLIAGYLTAFLAATASQLPAAELVHAEFRPDHYQFQAGSQLHGRIADQYKHTGPRGGHFLVHLVNDQDQEVHIEDVRLDGVSLNKGLKSLRAPLGRHYPIHSLHFQDPALEPWPEKPVLLQLGEPIWYTIQPRIIQPGQSAHITVRTRHALSRNVTVSVMLNDGRELKALVEPNEPQLWITFAGLNDTLDRWTIYVEKHAESDLVLDRVFLNGTDVTDVAKIGAVRFYRQFTPVVVPLSKSVVYGSRHRIEITTTAGHRLVESVRAWNDFFPIMMYGHGEHGITDRERAISLTEELRAHHFNTKLGGGGGVLGGSPASLRVMRRANLWLVTSGKPQLFPFVPESVWALELQDEPDANDPQIVPDNFPVKVDHRIGFSAMYNVGLMEEKNALAPHKPVWLQINHTGAPQNHFIYGRLADVHCHDPYHRGSATNPKSIRRVFSQGVSAYLGGLPNPNHLTLLTTKREDHNDPRWPFGEEIRLEAYYALACSAKGMSYWLYHNTGAANSPPLLAEIGRVNLEIATAAPWLARAQAVDELVTTARHSISPMSLESEAQVFQQVLLVGDEALILLLTNETYQVSEDRLEYETLHDVTLRIARPPWLQANTCIAIAHHGVHQLPARWDESRIEIDVDRLGLTMMIVIGDDELRQQIGQRYRKVVEQSQHDVARTQSERKTLLGQYARIRKQRSADGIVARSSFEPTQDEDWIDGWVIRDGAQVDDSVARTGSYSVRCDRENRGMYSGAMIVAAGTTFHVRAYQKSTVDAGIGSILFIRYLNKQGREIGSAYGSPAPARTAWEPIQAEFTAPEATTKVQLFLGNSSPRGVIWFDDILLRSR